VEIIKNEKSHHHHHHDNSSGVLTKASESAVTGLIPHRNRHGRDHFLVPSFSLTSLVRVNTYPEPFCLDVKGAL